MQQGKQLTPADLYKLDKYWQMQGSIRNELTKLNEKQIALLTQKFQTQFFDIYKSIEIEGLKAFSTIDTQGATQLINQIWCADGKTWSERVWGNSQMLQEQLNESLVECVITGKKTTNLTNILQSKFDVSYNNARAVARTEMAHIQTQAAQQRYKDYGLEQFEVWADEDERRCEICGELHQTKYPIGAVAPIPAHTNCRCCIVPVI